MQKVFISYVNDTRPIAQELARTLNRRGIETWADWRLKPGDRFLEKINQALDHARHVLFVIGPDSAATRLQEAEWQAALLKAWADPEKRLIPIVVGSGDPPAFLKNWESLHIDPAVSPQVWKERVINAIQSDVKPPTRALAEKNRMERQARMREIQRAAERMRSQPM